MTVPQELRQTPLREFHISPKTPYEHLKKVSGNFGVSNVRREIAEDVIANAQELEEKADWPYILRTLFAETASIRYIGVRAVAHTIAPTIGAIAVKMKWSMESPFLVYMSGFHFCRFLQTRDEALEKRLRNAAERTFTTPELKQKKIAEEREEAIKVNSDYRKLKEALDEYARQNLPQDPNYLKLLEALLYLKNLIKDTSKGARVLGSALKLFQEGKIEDCLNFMNEYSRRDTSDVD